MDACSCKYLLPIFENIPDELKSCPHWVAWKAVPNPKRGKPDKVPMNPKTGRGASPTQLSTWGSFDEAMRFYTEYQGKEHTHYSKDGEKTGPIAGVGFVLNTTIPMPAGQAPFVGIDLDHCIADDGNVEPWAQEIINTVGSYTELSPSGKGIHIFVRGRLPENGRKAGDIEMYQQGRYLTVTGQPLPESK